MKISSKKLEELMAKECVTLRELAVNSNLELYTLTRAKKGVSNVRPKTVGKIAKALGVLPTDILEKEE